MISSGTAFMVKWRSTEEQQQPLAAAGVTQQREIFDAFHGRVLAFFKSRGFSEDEALELTQEVFVRVFQNMEKLRSKTALDHWILRIAANVWKNEIRYRKAGKRDAQEVSLDDPYSDGDAELARALETSPIPTPLDEALASEQLVAVRRCLDALPPRMRRCLVLHVFQGHKYQEIADLLHLSIQSVKSHIHQARQHLDECVARRLAGGGP
jgi:RNA polymerase sigma-70 factor (ECF subfamily)